MKIYILKKFQFTRHLKFFEKKFKLRKIVNKHLEEFLSRN